MVIYMIAFYLWPLVRNLDLSFRDYTLGSFITGNAKFNGFDNYVKIFTDPAFPTALRNTLLFVAASLLFQFTIGLALAVFFHRNFPLSTTLRALFLVPWLLPLLVSASVWAWMMNSDSGVINYLSAGRRAASRLLADIADVVAHRGHHRQHLDRHPLQPGAALRGPTGDP